MTQTSHLKSSQITGLDASPIQQPMTGQGGPATLKSISASLSSVSADATGSTYQMVRVPTNAILKHAWFQAAANSGGKVNIGVYYSDSTTDGTAQANQGLVVPTTGAAFVSGDIDCSSAVAPTDELGQNTAGWTMDLINTPLWSALGLTADPGGNFDIVLVCHTTAITTGAKMTLQVDYSY